MKRIILNFILLSSLFQLSAFAANDITQTKIDYEVFKAQVESKIELIKETGSSNKILFQQELDAQNKIIEQLNHQIDWLGHYISLGSSIVTILLIAIGIISYRNARSDAHNTAKEVSESTTKTSVEKWFIENSEKAVAQINTLEKLVQDLQSKTVNLEASLQATHDTYMQKVNHSVAEIEKRGLLKENPLSAEEVNALKAKLEEIERKNTHLYTFEDWNTKAFDAYYAKRYDLASEFWDYASKATDATDEQVGSSLIYRAYILGNDLEQPASEIAIYDSLINKFQNSPYPQQQNIAAKALNNKALAQRKHFKNFEASIENNNLVIQKFDTSENVEVQEQLARAYLGVAFAKRYFNESEAWLEYLNLAIHKFGNSTHPPVQDQVARAYNGIGFEDLILAKQNWNKETLREQLLKTALNTFNKAMSICTSNACRGMILGNIAYSNWLLGNNSKTQEDLNQALTLGGIELYKATIKDTEEYTIPPDSTFRALVNKEWESIHPSN